MLQDNPLLAQLKQQLHKQTPRAEGIVRAHEKGFGFLDVDSKTSYFIPVNKMRKVLHGDKVSGLIITNNDKTTFEPETVIESVLTTFLGKIDFANKAMVLIPEDYPNITIRCRVNSCVKQRIKAGDWVKATLLNHALDEDKGNFFAEITDFVCEESSPCKLWTMTLSRYNLETSAPDDAEFSLNEQESERIDLTDETFFTIDSKETLDMDDALSLSQDESGYFHLAVAIADPNAYILETSKMDSEAMRRCFSTYLPSFNVPMLPKSLANELCSLKELEKRPSLVCKVKISPAGDIDYSSSQFMLAWVKSKAKLSYNLVSDYIENGIELPDEFTFVTPELDLLAKLADIRIQWRKDNALMFKDNSEYRFIFDHNRQLINISKENRRVGHRMVEEAMVIANQTLTHKLKHEVGFGVFNIHSGFDAKFLDAAVKLLNENQIDGFDKESISSFEGYIKLRRLLENNPILEYRLRRFQAPADFSFEAKPHFGMGFDAYATWTSPIRKYGDLINHRIIKALLINKPANKPNQTLPSVMNERRKSLRLAERDISERLYALYLKDKIGQTFEGEIIDINRGGARIRLTEIGALAFMPLSLIHSNREEIAVSPEEGFISVNKSNDYKLLDLVQATLTEVKSDNGTIIVKLAESGN